MQASHKDSNKEHSWIIFLGDFTGGALCFDDGTRVEEQYKWHKIDGHQYHWNEPHEGEKFSIVLYRSGAKKTKIQQINEAKKKKLVEKPKEVGRTEASYPTAALIDGLVEEFRLMVTKLLAPHRTRIENIPAPA